MKVVKKANREEAVATCTPRVLCGDRELPFDSLTPTTTCLQPLACSDSTSTMDISKGSAIAQVDDEDQQDRRGQVSVGNAGGIRESFEFYSHFR